jgi:uncharacterized protein (UPF0332 family)
MAEPLAALIYLARLNKSELSAVFALQNAFPRSGLFDQFQAAVEDVCIDRLIRADGCLKLAQELKSAGVEEEHLRAAISRAYYSMHHSLRALLLWQNKWDPDSHEETIKQFKEQLKDKAFRARSGLLEDEWEQVAEARNNRHVADYSPYDRQREAALGIIHISEGNWNDAAQFNIALAEKIREVTRKVIGT